jgi:hypothetical protein
VVNAYLPRLHAAASTDSSLARAFIRVVGRVDRPQGLLRPDRALRVLWGAPGPASGPSARSQSNRPASGKETYMIEQPAGDLVGQSRAATPPCYPTRTVASGPPTPAPTARSPLSSITYRETVKRPPHAARVRASTDKAR